VTRNSRGPKRPRSRRPNRFHWILAEEQVPLLIVDGAFATVVAIAHRGTGRRIVPRRVELTRRRADEPTLTRHFGCDIHFDAPLDLLVLTQNEDLLAIMLPDSKPPWPNTGRRAPSPTTSG
jgi:hypothetical protein